MAHCPQFFDYLGSSSSIGDGDDDQETLPLAWASWCRMYSNYSDHERRNTMFRNRPVEVLLQMDDFHEISPGEHKTLYDYWAQEARNAATSGVQRLMAEYGRSIEEFAELKRSSDLDCLKSASVVGMTTTYVAMHQELLAGLRPKIVLLEEAAEVLEAHVLTSLSSSTQQLIMIGDHEQLRPKVDNFLLQVHSESGFNLDISLFERLITENSVNHITLESQRRMRPSFSRSPYNCYCLRMTLSC